MNTKLLEQIGLTEEQAKIYTVLVAVGTLQARKISIETHINRSLVYKVLKQLIELELVVENIHSKSISTFTALHPSKLHSLVQKKEESLKLADQSFHEVVQVLGTQYNLAHKKPSVRFYEGVGGIKFLYKDILHAGCDIEIIRSQQSENGSEMQTIIDNQIILQAEKGIHTRAIVPTELLYNDSVIQKDKKYLITRCRIPHAELDIPALIIIYGTKVAMVSFGENTITTIIEDKVIAETYTKIFERLWKTGLAM